MMKPTQILLRRALKYQSKRRQDLPRKLFWGTKSKRERYQKLKAYRAGKAPKKIVKGDYVQVVKGRNSSQNHQGKVKKINYWTRKVQVEGFATLPRKSQREDGSNITQMVERYIPLKYVRLVDPETEKPISVSLVTLFDEETGEGRKYRLNKKTASIVPFPVRDADSEPEEKQQLNTTTDTDKDVVRMATYYEEEFIQLKNEYLRVMELQEWNEAKRRYEADLEKAKRQDYIQQEHDVLVVKRAQEILREQQENEKLQAIAKEHQTIVDEEVELVRSKRAGRMAKLKAEREEMERLREEEEQQRIENEEKQIEQRRLMAEERDDNQEDFFDVEHSIGK
mmetsp:Transcript_112/g.198  ORF Transcript_112/g.198 Transcript_112/m.198 type:complete len:338 (+) Transcript_112:30-1043(+)